VIFDSFDFHLADGSAEPNSADPILIEISFSEHCEGEWDDSLVGRLNRNRILQVDNLGVRHVLLRVTCAYDAFNRDFEQNWCFLNLNRQPLTGVADTALAALQREVAFFYLTALRDAARHPPYQERCHPSQSQTRGLDGAEQCVVTARRSRLMSEGG